MNEIERIKQLIESTSNPKKNINKDIHKGFIRNQDGFKIFWVDGELIRDTFDINFLMGGNGYAYNYVPKNEIWIENTMNHDDEEAIIVHEVTEALLMKNKGLSYEEAHKIATKAEKNFRTNHKLSLDNMRK